LVHKPGGVASGNTLRVSSQARLDAARNARQLLEKLQMRGVRRGRFERREEGAAAGQKTTLPHA